MIKFSGSNVLIHYISPVITIPSKNGGQDFHKRELIIDDSWDKDGKHYSNFVLIEFSGDRMGIVDSYFPGQRVNVEGMISGREYNNRIFNTVKGTSITPAQAQQQYAPAPAPAPMPGYPQPQQQYAPQYPQQPAPGYPRPYAPAYPQQPVPQPTAQPRYPPSPAPVQQSYSTPSSAPGVNDLPFSTR